MQDVAPRALNHLNLLGAYWVPTTTSQRVGWMYWLTGDTAPLGTGGRSSMEHSDCPSYYPIAVTKG